MRRRVRVRELMQREGLSGAVVGSLLGVRGSSMGTTDTMSLSTSNHSSWFLATATSALDCECLTASLS